MRRQGLAPRTGVVHGFAWIEGRGTGVVHVRPRHSPCPRFRRRRPSPRTFVDGPPPDSPHGISLRTVPRRSPMSCVGGGRRGETGFGRIQKACPGPWRPSPDENLVGNEKPLRNDGCGRGDIAPCGASSNCRFLVEGRGTDEAPDSHGSDGPSGMEIFISGMLLNCA